MLAPVLIDREYPFFMSYTRTTGEKRHFSRWGACLRSRGVHVRTVSCAGAVRTWLGATESSVQEFFAVMEIAAKRQIPITYNTCAPAARVVRLRRVGGGADGAASAVTRRRLARRPRLLGRPPPSSSAASSSKASRNRKARARAPAPAPPRHARRRSSLGLCHRGRRGRRCWGHTTTCASGFAAISSLISSDSLLLERKFEGLEPLADEIEVRSVAPLRSSPPPRVIRGDRDVPPGVVALVLEFQGFERLTPGLEPLGPRSTLTKPVTPSVSCG